MTTPADEFNSRPGENGLAIYLAVAGVPITPIPKLWRRSVRACGANPLKWLALLIGTGLYALTVVVYLIFTLGIAVSILVPWLLALPLVAIVYLTKAIGRRRPGLLGPITGEGWWDGNLSAEPAAGNPTVANRAPTAPA